MIKSMTGFARSEADTPSGRLAWELRSVNHRYLDVSIKLPEILRVLEPIVRERAGATLKRGRLEAYLRFEATASGAVDLQLNEALLARLVEMATTVRGRAPELAPANGGDLLRWPGVVEHPQPDTQSLSAAATTLVDGALEQLRLAREREGARIRELLGERLTGIGRQVAAVREVYPEALRAHRQRITDRLAEIRAELDPARVEQEIVLFAQKADIAEELDRLATHVTETQRVIDGDGPAGRRLDFLMQEFNREANTLGSKAADIRITHAAVELKVLIEQMREQIQNVE